MKVVMAKWGVKEIILKSPFLQMLLLNAVMCKDVCKLDAECLLANRFGTAVKLVKYVYHMR